MLKEILIAQYVEGMGTMKPKLSSTVSVVKNSESVLEFFKTNIRQSVRIKVNSDKIMRIVTSLDGERDVTQIASDFDVDEKTLQNLLSFLQNKGILDNVSPHEDFSDYGLYRRVIHFLSEYSSSHEQLLRMWNNIRNSNVLIVGLGAVGTWLSCNLIQSGLKNISLMDGDIVDISNLHRQFGFCEDDIGKLKVDVLAERLQSYSSSITINKIPHYLTEESLHYFDNTHIDLIINCADKPNVDTTSLWIGEYAMKHGIPHIIGGGYNMHISLIGQTVIPGKTSCIMCFQKTLEEENTIDTTKVKKLSVKNRKIGSFGPMCSLIASMTGMEALKILSKEISPSNINRRGEFDIYSMSIKYQKYERRDDCEWCGKNGKYYRS